MGAAMEYTTLLHSLSDESSAMQPWQGISPELHEAS